LKTASEAAAADQSLVLLIFSAEWCGPCKLLKKNSLAAKEFTDGGGALRVTDVDIDADEKTARRFEVNAVPTLVLLTADGKIVSRRTGYLSAADLLSWIEEGRRRAKAGQWEGTAPGSKIDAFAAKASGDGLNTNDLATLVQMLGEPDPGQRASVAKLLLGQREQAVPSLIAAMSDPYLGVRIGASDLLARLAPEVASLDPWQSPLELSNTVVSLKKWWSDTGKLPTPSTPKTTDSTVQGSIKSAIDDLRGDDPVQRTEAMSTLVGQGAAALPSVREAIKRHERTDPRLVVLLEDVRWAILISDTLERRAGGVRAALARGTSAERQTAAAQLGRAGPDAIDALAELANDSDPLLVESAVRALSAVGGKDVIPAMAALLNASDSNLRMTAAQALGRTRSAEATKHLLTVLDDPNEIVACTGLAALEEIHSKNSPFNPSPGANDSLNAEMIAALKGALVDSRWRVRAAAVELVGKLQVSDLASDAKKLLNDPDGFVVKNTLVTLSVLSAAPDVEQLMKLARRMPALQSDAVAMMKRLATDDSLKAVTELYDSGNPDQRVAILNALGRREKYDMRPLEDIWKPLLSKAASSPDARLRRAAVDLIGMTSPTLAADMIGLLLLDQDSEACGTAAEVVLGILAGRKSGALLGGSFGRTDFDSENVVSTSGAPASKASKTNAPIVSTERLAIWRSNLLQRAGADAGPSVVAALYATGDPKSDLQRLAAAIDKADDKALKRLAASAAMTVIVPKLPWPEGKAVLDAIGHAPQLYVLAAVEHARAKTETADYLLQPAQFLAAVEPAHGDDLKVALQQLLTDFQAGDRRPWSLMAPTERTRQIVTALLDSTNAAWRAAAVYVLARRDADKNGVVFDKALKDSSPWVRWAGVQGLARAATERAALEERVGPLLASTNLYVAYVAAMALLEPELRSLAGLQYQLDFFRFEDFQTGSSQGVPINEDRPLATLESKPAYLEGARGHLTASNEVVRAVFALLLAQHGEFDGVDRIVAQLPENSPNKFTTLPDTLLTGIALSRDAKYIPALRRMMERTQQDWELHKILRALKGMSGADARQLRLDVNKRMRVAGTTRVVE
jgi:HEAT repeat protein